MEWLCCSCLQRLQTSQRPPEKKSQRQSTRRNSGKFGHFIKSAMCILICTTLVILPQFHLYLVNSSRSWSAQKQSFWRRWSSSHHTIWSVWMKRAHHLKSPARRKPSSVISIIWNPSTAGTEFRQSNIMVNSTTLHLQFSFLKSIRIVFIYVLV